MVVTLFRHHAFVAGFEQTSAECARVESRNSPTSMHATAGRRCQLRGNSSKCMGQFPGIMTGSA